MSNSMFTRKYGSARPLLLGGLVLLAVLLCLRAYTSYVDPELLGGVNEMRRRDRSRHGGGIAPTLLTQRDGKRFLYGGKEDEQAFDIETFRLAVRHLNYGLGRERFPALIEPQFDSAEQADYWLTDRSPVLAVKIGAEVRVYPRFLLRQHEVVNDMIGDTAILVVYCVLADLGAVYDRTMGGHRYTFGVSGYTYGVPGGPWDGKQAFVLWDRDTESLWWPPIGKAVSGPAVDMPMQVLDESLWAQSTWLKIKADYPQAVVLSRGQMPDITRPWPKHDLSAAGAVKANPPQVKSIAPRWGENATFN